MIEQDHENEEPEKDRRSERVAGSLRALPSGAVVVIPDDPQVTVGKTRNSNVGITDVELQTTRQPVLGSHRMYRNARSDRFTIDGNLSHSEYRDLREDRR